MASITLEGKEIKPSKSIRFLGAYLDQSLSYKAHLNALNIKIPILYSALRSITSSTWGTALNAARTLYRGAIRPVLAYGALFWCPENLEKAKGLVRSLQSIQGRFLRTIIGAYRATSYEALEIETFTEPLDLYIERAATQGASRQALRGYGKEGRLFREVLRNRFRRGRRLSPTTSSSSPRNPEKLEITEILTNIAANPSSEEYLTLFHASWKGYIKALEAFYATKWKNRWEKSEKGRAIAIYYPQPIRKALDLYKNRPKPFSSMLIQLRTTKIGLNSFLKNARVPGIEALCECQEEEETIEHFLFKCPRWKEQRVILNGLKTVRETLRERKNSEKAVKFLLATRRLEQFSRIDCELALEAK